MDTEVLLEASVGSMEGRALCGVDLLVEWVLVDSCSVRDGGGGRVDSPREWRAPCCDICA